MTKTVFLDVCDNRGVGSYKNVDDVAVVMARDGGVEDDSRVEQRFGCPVTEDEILKKIDGAIPRSTKKTTTWSVKVWNSWRESRLKSVETAAPPLLDNITNAELNHWLSRFLLECRNQQGEYYTGTTLYSLCAGVQRFIREERAKVSSQKDHLDIYSDPKFAYFRSVLNSILKELHQKGIGTSKKQAEVVSTEMEEQLWEQGILGDDTPQKLLDTMVFCLGMNLALRSGKEH